MNADSLTPSTLRWNCAKFTYYHACVIGLANIVAWTGCWLICS